ncbi:MAG TPA: YbaB/EbfC family nucleoid-associated protein [Desulfatiglandales bacterium]|nr:YbaB/EbfC family nucleoid-associated protein [Desulfatiglandales bacterium]
MIGIPNMGNLMKQAQQIQAKIAKLREELGERSIEVSSGGGMVTVVVNGRQELLSIKIDPEVINAHDSEMLQDLILAAVNDGMARAKNMVTEEMRKLTGGIDLSNIPGLI